MLDLTEGMLQGRSVSEFIRATLTIGIPTDARAGEPLDRGLQGNSLREFVVSTLPQGQPLRAVRSETMPSAQTSFKRSSPSPSICVVRVIESPTPPPSQTETTLVKKGAQLSTFSILISSFAKGFLLFCLINSLSKNLRTLCVPNENCLKVRNMYTILPFATKI